MVDWKRIKCYQCRHCNEKGKPSVMKGSAFCESNRGIITDERASAWGKIRGLMSFR